MDEVTHLLLNEPPPDFLPFVVEDARGSGYVNDEVSGLLDADHINASSLREPVGGAGRQVSSKFNPGCVASKPTDHWLVCC
jgi:hypothetical protein